MDKLRQSRAQALRPEDNRLRMTLTAAVIALAALLLAMPSAADSHGDEAEPPYGDNECANDRYEKCVAKLEKTRDKCEKRGRSGCEESFQGQKAFCDDLAQTRCK